MITVLRPAKSFTVSSLVDRLIIYRTSPDEFLWIWLLCLLAEVLQDFFFLKNSMHLITRLRSLYGRIFSIGCLSNLWIMIVNSQVALCLELVLSKRIPEFGLYFLWDDLVSQRSQAPKTCRVYPSFECRHFLRMYSVWGFLYPFRVLSGVEVTVFSSMTLYCKRLHCSVQFPSSLSNSGPQSGKTIQFSKLPCI